MSELDSPYWKEVIDALNEAGQALGQRVSNLDGATSAMAAAGQALQKAARAVNNLQADLSAED